MKKLVIYYSLEGNTRFIAEQVAAAVAADLLELKPKHDIQPRGFMRYFWGGKQVIMQAKPELLPFAVNPADYDLLFIGTPVWAWNYAPALNTFFAKVKLQGKLIGLFCCSGGMEGKTRANMARALAGNTIIGEIGFQDPLKHDRHADAKRAQQWAQELVAKAEHGGKGDGDGN